MDKVIVRKLCLRVSLTSGPKPIHQPILISVFVPTDVGPAADADDVTLSVDYAQLVSEIRLQIEDKSFPTLLNLAQKVSDLCPPGTDILAEQPRGHLRFSSIGLRLSNVKSKNSDDFVQQLTSFILDLRVSAIVGINPEERMNRQTVSVDMKFGESDFSVLQIADGIAELVESSTFYTVEALAQNIMTRLQNTFKCKGKVEVNVIKPKAITYAEGAGVQLCRGPIKVESESLQVPNEAEPTTASSNEVIAYIAFGSNIEPRIDYIKQALKMISACSKIKVLDTSFLYESTPMYHLDQDDFYNGVVKIQTTKEPIKLLHFLKKVETKVGRKSRFENGPREIDLDILLYGNVFLTTSELLLPHPKIHEREFVVKPLADLQDKVMEIVINPTVLLNSLLRKGPSAVRRVMPLPPTPASVHSDSPAFEWESKTFIMGILNICADSFSEAGCTDVETAVKVALKMEADAADIIDIGAASRSPGRTESISTEDEVAALTSVIKRLRTSGLKVPISVDIFKADVAKAAIEAGASIINDVGTGKRDTAMFDVAAEMGVPIIIMHTRGTPADMHKYTTYDNDDVVGGVIDELRQAVEKAIAAGVYRWNIILDPGIGFAKTGDQNLEILQNLQQFKSEQSPLRGFPLLIGCSRKKFIGTLTGVEEPIKRGAGSMASTAASIFTGADIVRVHDVKENSEVAKFADAFWRK